MKIKDLIKVLDGFSNKDDDVVIYVTTAVPSIGPTSDSDIGNFMAGFDWDKNKLFIIPERKLTFYSDENETVRLKKKIQDLQEQNFFLERELKALKQKQRAIKKDNYKEDYCND